MSGDEPKQVAKKRSFWRELPVLLALAFLVALLVKTFLLQAFWIPSESMEMTLVEGDRVLVEKLSYRVGEVERGDVIVFEKELVGAAVPNQDKPVWQDVLDAFRSLFGFPSGSREHLIKRVIAIGGDTVEGRDGVVHVNGKRIEEPYVSEGIETSTFGPIEIPAGSVFVMGDNRPHSGDSRSFGPVSEDKIVGRAFVLIWPPADLAKL